MIGDAAWLNRPFKGKGINSAIITGIKATLAMALKGLSRLAFEGYREDCSELREDIPCGRILRALTIRLSGCGLTDGVLEAARKEPALGKAIFNVVLG